MLVAEADILAFVGLSEANDVLRAAHAMAEAAADAFVGWKMERATYTRFLPVQGGRQSDPFVGSFGGMSGVGGSRDILQLGHKWVWLAGLEVWERRGAYFGQVADSPFDADHKLTLGSDFILETETGVYSEGGRLVRLTGHWETTPGSVKVVYAAGFTQAMAAGTDATLKVPAVGQAIKITVAKAYNEITAHQVTGRASGAGPGVLSSESIQGYSYSIDATTNQALTGLLRTLPVEAALILQPFRSYGRAFG